MGGSTINMKESLETVIPALIVCPAGVILQWREVAYEQRTSEALRVTYIKRHDLKGRVCSYLKSVRMRSPWIVKPEYQQDMQHAMKHARASKRESDEAERSF